MWRGLDTRAIPHDVEGESFLTALGAVIVVDSFSCLTEALGMFPVTVHKAATKVNRGH